MSVEGSPGVAVVAVGREAPVVASTTGKLAADSCPSASTIQEMSMANNPCPPSPKRVAASTQPVLYRIGPIAATPVVKCSLPAPTILLLHAARFARPMRGRRAVGSWNPGLAGKAIMAGKLQLAAKCLLGTTLLASGTGGVYYATSHGWNTSPAKDRRKAFDCRSSMRLAIEAAW